MSVKISALPAVTEFSDDALLVAEEADGTTAITAANLKKQLAGSAVTGTYNRDELPTPAKTTITIHSTAVKIGDEFYANADDVTLNLAASSAWDSSTYATASNRAGKDFYIYVCTPSDSTEPSFILSANSTVPSGYTASNSRKIGGFHCLCLSVGTITDHPLSGYVTGDILPASVWDLFHRCKDENEGMVYDEDTDLWVSIYLLSYNNGKPVSVYNGVILDGASTPKVHGIWFIETLAKQNMRLPYIHEFFTLLKGCQELAVINGAADPNTTGGHVYANGVRCVSNIGLEDPAGVMYQWTNNYYGAGGGGWGTTTYNSSIDSKSCGDAYGTLYLPTAGGSWTTSASNCGSRCIDGNAIANKADNRYAARSVSEPRTEAAV